MSTNSAQRRFDDALDGLRQVFRNCRGTSYWGDMTDSSVTINRPVWDLTDKEFKDVGWHSLCLGPPEELATAIRYFLPRVALLHASPNDPLHNSIAVWDLEQLANVLNKSQWLSWRRDEVKAIREWLFAWIQLQASEGNWWNCEETVRCAALVDCDLFEFFSAFENTRPTVAAVWLAAELEHHWDSMLTTGWPSGWQKCWGIPTPPEVAERFLLLLLRRSSRQFLEQAFYSGSLSLEHQGLVSAALEHANQCVEFGKVWPDAPLGRALANPAMEG